MMRAVSRRISFRSAAIKGEYFNQGFCEIARGRDIESVPLSDFSLAVLAAKSIVRSLLILEIIRVIFRSEITRLSRVRIFKFFSALP